MSTLNLSGQNHAGLPKTNMKPDKGPFEKGKTSSHQFLGSILVFRGVSDDLFIQSIDVSFPSIFPQ